MNHLKGITKLLLLGYLLLFSAYTQGQIVLNVSGQVLFEDGSPAIETGLLLTFSNDDLGDFTTTDINGNYNFLIDLPLDYIDSCFTLIMINCNGEFVTYEDCLSESNYEFQKDFLFCQFGTTFLVHL